MPLQYILILAIVQGITEFLPISSSAHLILMPTLTGEADQGVVIDVAVHVGTLFAVLLYFRSEFGRMIGALAAVRSSGEGDGEHRSRRLGLNVLVAALPVLMMGLVLHVTGIDAMLRSITIIGWASLLFGVVLWLADRMGGLDRSLGDMGMSPALMIGLAQVLALIPGASRAGVTITAARMLGYKREDAARFSMFLAVPVIGSAGLLGLWDIVTAGNAALGFDALIASILSIGVAYASIAIFLQMTRRFTMTPFVIYRCLLGAALLAVGYGWV